MRMKPEHIMGRRRSTLRVETLLTLLAGVSVLAGCDETHVDQGSAQLAVGEEDEEMLEALESVRTVAELLDLVPIESLPAELLDMDGDAPMLVVLDDAELEDLDGPERFAAELEPQQIGEFACATASIANPANGQAVAMDGFEGVFSATSPNASYSPAGCPKQFITEVTQTSGRDFDIMWDWHGVGLGTAYQCENARAKVSVYGRYLTMTSPFHFEFRWRKLRTSKFHGEFSDDLLSICSFAIDGFSLPLQSFENSSYSTIRTAVQATWGPGDWDVRQRVEGGIRYYPAPS